MYQVLCKGLAGKWMEYSGKHKNIEKAIECMKEAEKRNVCDVNGVLIKYKIIKLIA